ncbi:MAG: transcriptional regulator [Candidatus Aureabacteria bacterium]|nr:transcriptional regulator [Candidatus Auribacterota bacterium]
MGSKEAELLNFLKKKGGLASYADLSKAGFNKNLLKTSLKCNRINRIDKGLYQLSEGMSFSNPDLVIISIKVPRGVVCLLSALAFHEATNEIPKYVDVAIPRGTHANKIKYPPVKFYRFASITWKPGIEEHKVGDHKIKVYSLARTIADCFKFRNRIGVNVARDALKIAVTEKGIEPKEIMHFAKICRVDKIIKPMLETML